VQAFSPGILFGLAGWGQSMKTRKCVAAAGMAALWFASPAHAQVDPAKCRAPMVSSDERIAACTLVIEAAKASKEGLAWAYRFRAREYQKIRDFDHALADYSQVLQLYPQDRYAYICRGDISLHKWNFDQAIADFGQAIAIDPNNGAAYVNRAAAYFHKDEFERAFADYSRALELNSSDVHAYLSRGSAYRVRGDVDRAIADYDRAIQISPTYKYAYFGRGGAYEVKGDFGHAIADYDEGIRLDPKDARAYRMRGLVNLRAGSLPKSLADLDQSQGLDPKDAYMALWRDIVAKRGDQPSRLAGATAQLDMTKWPAPAVRLFLGEMTLEAVLAAADSPDPGVQKGQICEANFYAGELALQRGRNGRRGAAVRPCCGRLPEEFRRMVGRQNRA
jgi:tetratricopeptide (TPR) repeat protein